MARRIVLWGVGALAAATAVGVLAAAAAKKPRDVELRAEKLEPRFERLKALHAAKTPPKPGEWLESFPEKGQSVAEFMREMPDRPTAKRRTIYLQPIGAFAGARGRILAATADYVERFFGLPVKTLPAVPLSQIPAEARRVHPSWGNEQILAPWVNNNLLYDKKPADAVAMLGLTDVDLYPEPSWNFVFGQAATDLGVGVWSIWRDGDPEKQFKRVLTRAIQTATHEIGHLFGLAHCIGFECQMNGSNNREEADSRPLEVCPACLQKLCAFTGSDPVVRFTRLAEFADAQGFAEEAQKLRASAKLLKAP